MLAPETEPNFLEAIRLIEKDERTQGGVVACSEEVEGVIVLGNIVPNLTMGTLEGYVPPGRAALDEPAV